MKVQWLLPATVVMSITLVGIIKIRQKEYDKHYKQNMFQDIRLRVTYDVLGEYQSEKADKQNLLDQTNADHRALEEAMSMLQAKADKSNMDVDSCQANKKTVTDQLASVETELNNLKAQQEKEKTSLKTEEEALKQKLAGRSLVCEFVKKDSLGARNLCGEAKKEEPKAEAPKQEDAKAQAPKQEDAKAQAPKQEDAKAQAPKQEDAKAQAPKKEDAKAEAPKKEDAKAEAPKKEDAKAQAPKKEDAKAEARKS